MTASLYGPAFFEGRSPLVQQSAAAVVPHLIDLLAPESVLDIGCGKGEWLEAFDLPLERRCGVDVAAPDGPEYAKRDLTQPLHLGTTFDLVLCIETGEHLAAPFADTLVDSCVRHGGDIVFGAAVPGQEGIGHVNCQSHEYWHEKFAARGYEMFDVIRPRIKNDDRVSPWYRNNMFLYMDAAS